MDIWEILLIFEIWQVQIIWQISYIQDIIDILKKLEIYFGYMGDLDKFSKASLANENQSTQVQNT